jgi:hypothetical protein
MEAVIKSDKQNDNGGFGKAKLLRKYIRLPQIFMLKNTVEKNHR